jgi:hypothetical protein
VFQVEEERRSGGRGRVGSKSIEAKNSNRPNGNVRWTAVLISSRARFIMIILFQLTHSRRQPYPLRDPPRPLSLLTARAVEYRVYDNMTQGVSRRWHFVALPPTQPLLIGSRRTGPEPIKHHRLQFISGRADTSIHTTMSNRTVRPDPASQGAFAIR